MADGLGFKLHLCDWLTDIQFGGPGGPGGPGGLLLRERSCWHHYPFLLLMELSLAQSVPAAEICFPRKNSRTLSKNITKAHPFSKFEKRGFPPKIPHLTTSLNLARRLQIGMSNSFSPGRPALMAPSPGAMQVTGGAGITENLDRPNMPVTPINLASSPIHILKIWPPQVRQPVRERLVERSSRPSKRGGDREERTSYHK